MTFCKLLAQHQTGRYTVSAYQETDKFCSVPRYSVVVSRDGIGLHLTKAAKTTWRKKFRETVSELA